MNVGQKAVRLLPHGFSFTKTGKFGILSDRTMIKGGDSMEVGFIRDKLEIKFLILYIAARLSDRRTARPCRT